MKEKSLITLRIIVTLALSTLVKCLNTHRSDVQKSMKMSIMQTRVTNGTCLAIRQPAGDNKEHLTVRYSSQQGDNQQRNFQRRWAN